MTRLPIAFAAALVATALDVISGGAARAQPAPAPAASPEARPRREPWTLAAAAGLPAWLRVGLEHQARIEQLANDFRSGASDARALSLRTLVRVEATHGPVVAGFELEDSRAFVTDATPINPTIVNPVELLQAYVGAGGTDLLRDGDALDVRAGRLTIDLGTRRLVARNRFRNTINGFTGLDARWTSPGKHVARGFVAVPVTRLPADADSLRDNEIELDEENTDALLWGASYGSAPLVEGMQLELFVVGFHERDGDVASRDRQLLTLGARWFRKPARGTVDLDVEIMPQLGTSRSSTAAADTTDLDHRALSTHAEVGISPAMPGKPRFVLQHDYASGDADPADSAMGRFDPLFGARRFDFGPTGIYGAFARSNLHSPGARISIAPSSRFDAFASYRLFWLASARDAWTTAGLGDPTGGSGSFLGHQVEAQARWSLVPRTFAVEAGAAHLRRGRFARTAPDARDAPATYVYLQLNLAI